MSETLITSIATKARFKSVEEYINAGWSPTHADKHGDEILAIMHEYCTFSTTSSRHASQGVVK
jgi:hypothetical protein